MKISVIIPCLNAATTIAQQLEALVQQSVQPWEVIVADNGSTDQTREIVQKFADRFPRFQLIEAHARKGASHARNQGAIAATGDYLAFCDADDVVSRDWLLAFQREFKAHNFLASRFDYTLLNGDFTNKNQDSGLVDLRIPFLPFAGGGGLGVSRALHQAIGGFDEAVLYLEDTDYCFRIQLLGETLTFVPEAVIHIRYCDGQRRSFLATRKACFNRAYNWGTGLAEIYGKYRHRGMKLHGIAPRIPLIGLWTLRFLVSGLGGKSLERLGWHIGTVQGLLKLHMADLLLRGNAAVLTHPAREN